MIYIDVRCKDSKDIFPKMFPVVPRKGETIVSVEDNFFTVLDIVYKSDLSGKALVILVVERKVSVL